MNYRGSKSRNGIARIIGLRQLYSKEKESHFTRLELEGVLILTGHEVGMRTEEMLEGNCIPLLRCRSEELGVECEAPDVETRNVRVGAEAECRISAKNYRG